MKTDPFWWEAARPGPAQGELPDHTVDVLIIGAGYTGLSAALTLARRGLDVTVLEAETPGFGASSRNGGMISNMLKPGLSGLIDAFGVEAGCAIYKEALASVAFTTELIETAGIECDLTLNGRFYPAVQQQHYTAQARDFDLRQKYLHIAEEMVGATDYDEDVFAKGYCGGLRQHHTGGLHPAKYVKGLASAAGAAGARLIAPCRAEQITRTADGFTVTSTRGEVRARHLLMATNGYGGALDPYLKRRVFPVETAMIATAELPADLVTSLFPKGRMISDSAHMMNYYRPSPCGRRVLLGARPTLFPASMAVKAKSLKKSLVAHFPMLESAPVSHVWAGNVAYDFAALPSIGVHEGVHYALGYCGSGVAMSGYLGHKAALKILGDPAGATAFDTVPFEDRFYYHGAPWFLTPAMIGYRLRDYFGF